MYQRARITRHAGATAAPLRARWKNAFVPPGTGGIQAQQQQLQAQQQQLIAGSQQVAASPPPAPLPPPTMPDLFSPEAMAARQRAMQATNAGRSSTILSTLATRAPLAAGAAFGSSKLGA
jgi:hypothetical protein